VTLTEAATGKPLRSLPGPGVRVLASDFSADGTRFVMVGDDETARLCETAMGKELRRFRAPDAVRTAALSPDGKLVAVGTAGGRLRCWDAAAPAAPVEPEQTPIHAVAFAPGARAVATLERGAVRLWAPASSRQLKLWREEQGHFTSLAFAPDGGLLALGGARLAGVAPRGLVRLVDPDTGREVRTLELPGERVLAFTFLGEGGLATLTADGTVWLWDQAGKQRREFATGVKAVQRAAFSSDGRLLACSADPGPVEVWDTSAGHRLRRVGKPQLPPGAFAGVGGFGQPWRGVNADRVRGLAFAPDGRTLATVDEAGRVRIEELASGQVRAQFTPRDKAAAAPKGAIPLAFSPDGRLLAVGVPGGVGIWDVATGSELPALRGHRDLVSAVAFRPDGAALLSASGDTTALLWDMVEARRQLPRPRLTDEAVAEAWAALVGKDPIAAHRHLWALAGDPAKAVPLLKANLRPVPPLARRLDEMIADLDSPRFQVREKAMAELARLSALARPALSRALARDLPLEARRRIERLLVRMEGVEISPEQLRMVRGVEVLEQVGTVEARALLEELARGEPEAPGTVEARAALTRLAPR
jgi:WD40 repeat protein